MTIKLGGSKDPTQFRTHLHVQQSRLRAQKLIKQLRPATIENSTDFKNGLLATSIELVIRSLAVNNNKETAHHARSLAAYPHRQYRLTLTETPTFAGHLGSLGYISSKQQVIAEPLEALEIIIDEFFREHSIQQNNPKLQESQLLSNLNFSQHSEYIDQLQDLLQAAVGYSNPLLSVYNLILGSVSDLKYRLLLGAYSSNLTAVIEYFQALSNSLNRQLPTYPTSFIYQLLNPTLSFGYTAGPVLFYQALIVQQLVGLYKSIPDGISLESMPTEGGLLRLYSICDAFSILDRHRSVDYAESYYKRYRTIIKTWAHILGVESSIDSKPDYKDYRLLTTNYLEHDLPLPEESSAISILLTPANTRILDTLDLTILPLSRAYTEVVLVVGDYFNQNKDTYLDSILLSPLGSTKFSVPVAEPMVGYALLMVDGAVVSNTIIFEANSLLVIP